jgi:hypothetical protein
MAFYEVEILESHAVEVVYSIEADNLEDAKNKALLGLVEQTYGHRKRGIINRSLLDAPVLNQKRTVY